MSSAIICPYSSRKKLYVGNGHFKENLCNDFAHYVLNVALQELRENQQTRQQCLEKFREWIDKNQDIENCHKDDSFLLRFLRVKKFSLPMAQQNLLKYLNFRKRFKHIAHNMDYTDPKILALIDNGYIFVSPLRDAHSRRVIITNINKFDPYKYTSSDMARAHFITYETLIEDEENQILGFNHIGDGDGASAAYVGIWSITEFASLFKWGEQSFPIRHKACHVINLPLALRYVVDFACSRLSPKLRERLHTHASKSDLHKHVPAEVLPLEYGGVMPTSVMVELWKKELAAKRDRLLSYDVMHLLSDRGIIRSNGVNSDQSKIDELQGSFRKLEVD